MARYLHDTCLFCLELSVEMEVLRGHINPLETAGKQFYTIIFVHKGDRHKRIFIFEMISFSTNNNLGGTMSIRHGYVINRDASWRVCIQMVVCLKHILFTTIGVQL